MAILHTVNRSPFQRNSLASCVRVAQPGSALLLIEDGVYAARASGDGALLIRDASQRLQVYALSADLQARGIDRSELVDDVRTIDYAGFVDLACECDKVLAWS